MGGIVLGHYDIQRVTLHVNMRLVFRVHGSSPDMVEYGRQLSRTNEGSYQECKKCDSCKTKRGAGDTTSSPGRSSYKRVKGRSHTVEKRKPVNHKNPGQECLCNGLHRAGGACASHAAGAHKKMQYHTIQGNVVAVGASVEA